MVGWVSPAQQYPFLYNIASQKHMSVAQALTQPLNITFRRVLTENKWEQWLHLVNCLMDITLSNESDRFVWRLTSSGIFSVKSMYLDYLNGHTRFLKRYI